MLPRCLLLYFVSFTFAADVAVKNDYPLSDLRKLSQEDLMELNDFLARIQQALHPKDMVIEKLESAQAPFTRLVAKLAAGAPVKPLQKLQRKIHQNDKAFSSLNEVSAAADLLLAEQRQTYLSMRLILDAIFGVEDGESDGEDDSDSDELDGEDEDEAGPGFEDEIAEDELEDADEDSLEDGTEEADEDLDDYDWFYRIFGTKDKSARAAAVKAIDKVPGVGTLEIKALAQRSKAMKSGKQAESGQSNVLKAPDNAGYESEISVIDSATTESAGTASIETPYSQTSVPNEYPQTEYPQTEYPQTEYPETDYTKTKASETQATETQEASQSTEDSVLYSSTEKAGSKTASSTYYAPPSSSTLTLAYSQETPVSLPPPEDSVPVVLDAEESQACNLTFGNWSWDCAPASSGARRWLAPILLSVIAATALLAVVLA